MKPSLIDAWLEDATGSTIPKPNDSLRRSAPVQSSERPAKRRRVLHPILDNNRQTPQHLNVNMPPKKRDTAATRSPTRRLRIDSSDQPTSPLTRSQTSPLPLGPSMVLSPRSIPDSVPPAGSSVGPSPSERIETNTSLSRDAGTARSRSSSPTKGLANLKFRQAGITFVGVTGVKAFLDEPAMALYKQLNKYKNQTRVVPQAVTELMEAVMEVDGLDLEQENLMLEDSCDAGERIKEFDRIGEVVDESISCQQMQVGEAMWNCAVHYPMLHLALQRYKKYLRVLGVTTTPITSEYLPRTVTSRDPLDQRRIDFVIHLLPTTSLYTAISSHLSTTTNPVARRSINHAESHALTEHPIAISVETKATEGSVEDSKAQLATWAGAHFNRLRALLRERLIDNSSEPPTHPPLPCLPMVVAHAAEWSIFFAAPDNAAGEGFKVIGPVHIGDTSSYMGAYKVLAGLRACYDWARDNYTPWFEKLMEQVLDKGAA